jgi:23S rRNA pseudouridine1911/1915/1917 synthase
MAVLTRGGRPAETRYRVRRSFAEGALSLLDCRLLTGRTHQIRVHLSHIGHPLVGDRVYGRLGARRLARLPAPARAAVEALPRQALHARTLGFRHPVTADNLRFESDLPPDIKGLIKSLETL